MGQEFFAVSLRCRSWTCPECADQRRKELIAQAIDGKPNRFLTITSKRRENESPQTAAAELARCWRLIRKRLMRHYKTKSLPFLAVFEATKLGWPHLHILLRCDFIDQRLISKWMNELTASPVVWIEKIDSAKGASRYVSKYIGKDTQKFGSCKRYWQSQDWRVVPKRHRRPRQLPPGDWHVHDWPIARWIDTMRHLGASVSIEAHGAAYASLAQGFPQQLAGSG